MWSKSSYSAANGNCIEAADWRTSTYSAGNGNCVQVASGVLVRDSKLDDKSPVLKFNGTTWGAFIKSVKQIPVT